MDNNLPWLWESLGFCLVNVELLPSFVPVPSVFGYEEEEGDGDGDSITNGSEEFDEDDELS